MEVLGPVTRARSSRVLGLPRTAASTVRCSRWNRRTRAARLLHARRATRARVVRPPAARAHPPLHAQPPARRDRAGHRGRFHALPAALAARRRRAAGERRRRPRRGDRAARRLRARGGGMGARRAARARARLHVELHRHAVPLAAASRGAASTPMDGRQGAAQELADRAHAARARGAVASWRRPVDAEALSSEGRARCYEALRTRGASFFHELVAATGLLRTQVERALGELAGAGLVTADSFSGCARCSRRRRSARASRRTPSSRRSAYGVDTAGRWALLRPRTQSTARSASKRSRARCSSATASCSARCSRANRGCRRGASW